MRQLGIRGVQRTKKVNTTRSDPKAARPGDLVERAFTAERPNRLWVADLTHVATWSGVAYVCFITDAFSRRIVGWRVASNMRTQMVLDVLEMARWNRGTRLEGLVAHTDAGSQGGFKWSSQHLDVEVCDGWGEKERVKNGPALGGYGVESMPEALTDGFAGLPDQLRRSLTWDRGKELAQHAQLKVDTGLDVFFADPRIPWQRGMNENTNGLLRQYFPKGTDLSRWSSEDIDAVAATINSRPRKVLGWRTPAEALDEHLHSLQQADVASTG